MSTEYELIEPFDIDDGQLDGVRPQVVFSLGVEWEMLRQELDAGREMKRTIHAENLARFVKMCERRGRACVVGEMDSEYANEWASISVEAM